MMKRRALWKSLAWAVTGSFLLTGCQTAQTKEDGKEQAIRTKEAENTTGDVAKDCGEPFPDDWYRTCYEVFVYSFADSDGDGIGDLNGLKSKLDYLNDGHNGSGEDLEISELWLMPVFPSPTYHKYDTTDYYGIDPEYGTLEDFKELLAECHKRDVRVILDLALNHTSVDHPWFLDHPEYYCFSDTPQTGYAEFTKNGETRYYEARFWEGMPDLNLDSEQVRKEIEKITKYWLDLGVDGFRLDAVTSYYTDDAAANVEFLSWLNGTVKAQKADAYLVGECWAAQETYAKYYDSGVDSFFDFAFADQDGLIASVVRGSKGMSSYVEALEKEEAVLAEHDPGYINAPFYTNHDMGRSAGYYAYDDGTKTKFAGALNLLMPGNAFLYYGEEIGMKGSGKDENKRAPMQWGEQDAALCNGPAGMERINMKFGTVETQQKDGSSILQYYRKVIALRNRYPVIARGRTEAVGELCGKEQCAFVRSMEIGAYEPVMLVMNRSQEPETVILPDNGFGELSDMLLTGEEKAVLEDGKLTLPPYAVAVMTKK